MTGGSLVTEGAQAPCDCHYGDGVCEYCAAGLNTEREA